MKENWLLVVSFKTELLSESLIHKGYRKALPELLPKIPPFKNRMIIDNDIYIDLSETDKIQDYFSEDTINKVSNTYKIIEKQSQKLISVSKEIVKDFNSKTSNQEIIKRLRKFFKEYQACLGAIGVPTVIDLTLESKIRDSLKNSGIKDTDRFLLKIAVSFKQLESFKEKEDLLGIAIQIQDNKISLDSIGFKNLVKNHFKEYGWIQSTLFSGEIYDENQIIQKIKEVIKNAKEEKEKLLNERKNHLIEANGVIKKIKSNEEKESAKILQKAVYYRTARLEWMNKSCFIIYPILEEISKRLKLTFKDIIYMLPEEIEDSLKKEKVEDNLYKKIKERRIGYAYISDNSNEYLLVTNNKLNEWKEKFSNKRQGDIIQGIVTSKGEAKGEVVVVKDRSELNKVKEGNILVTPLTTPDFIIAMKKSIGIVTDLGGVTSHAAVTSRELKIPCIIGTKNATKILKDGDLIELDTKQGIVKIIKKNK